MREHRWIMQQYIKRELKSNEIVHHINDDSLDNRIENLKIMTRSSHMKLHENGKETRFKKGCVSFQKGKSPSKEVREKISKKLRGRGSRVKLTVNQVKEIKNLLSQGKKTQKEISEIYNVSAKNISMIKNKETWEWLE